MKASRGIQSIMVARKNGIVMSTTWQFNAAGVCYGVTSMCITRGAIGIDFCNPFAPQRTKVI